MLSHYVFGNRSVSTVAVLLWKYELHEKATYRPVGAIILQKKIHSVEHNLRPTLNLVNCHRF